MATRKAYAKSSKNGKAVFMFASKALRDFFIDNVEGYEVATCAEYRKAEREENRRDEWGWEIFSDYSAFDMSVPEYWDGWWDVYDEAYELGLL